MGKMCEMSSEESHIFGATFKRKGGGAVQQCRAKGECDVSKGVRL